MPVQSSARLDRNRPEVLQSLRGGRREELDELVALAYHERREIARRRRMAHDDASTLATTALVHEACIERVDGADAHRNDRAHFLARAAVAVRHIPAEPAKARMLREPPLS